MYSNNDVLFPAPEVGSSRMSTDGSCTSSTPMDVRRLSPPDTPRTCHRAEPPAVATEISLSTSGTLDMEGRGEVWPLLVCHTAEAVDRILSTCVLASGNLG